MNWLGTKLITYANKYFDFENAKEKKEFIDYFFYGIKCLGRNEIDDALEFFEHSVNSMTKIDKVHNLKAAKEFAGIKDIFKHFNMPAKTTFDGAELLELIKHIRQQYQEGVGSQQTTKESPNRFLEKINQLENLDEVVLSKKEEIIEKNIKKEQVTVYNDPQKVLDDIAKDIYTLINPTNPKNINKLFETIRETKDVTQLISTIRVLKEDIENIFSLENSIITTFDLTMSQYGKKDKNYYLSTENNILDNSYSLVKINYKPSTEEREKNRVKQGSIKLNAINFKDTTSNHTENLLGYFLFFAKAHYYYEIKSIIYDKLKYLDYSKQEKTKLENYIFGSEFDSFDRDNIYMFFNADPVLHNKNYFRSKIKKIILEPIPIGKLMTAEDHKKLENIKKIIDYPSNADYSKPSSLTGYIASIALTIALLGAGIAIYNYNRIKDLANEGGGISAPVEKTQVVDKIPVEEKIPEIKKEPTPPKKEENKQPPKKTSSLADKSAGDTSTGSGNGTGTSTGDGSGNGKPLIKVDMDNAGIR